MTQLKILTTFRKKVGKQTRTFANVKCTCGIETTCLLYNVKNGHTKSCSCLRVKLVTELKTKHGQRKHPLYAVWQGIKQRCSDKKHKFYKHYGGRNIAICSQWLNDFQNFYNWAISNGYKPQLQIDRINNDGNYEPENCRFVTSKENCSNKRNNVFCAIEGCVLTLAEGSRQLGFKDSYLAGLKNKGQLNKLLPAVVFLNKKFEPIIQTNLQRLI